MTNQFAENLRYLAWKKDPEHRERWPVLAASWIGCRAGRAHELIWGRGRSAQPEEIDAFAEACQREPDMVLHHRLVSSSEILSRNIDYLFDGLGHGTKGEFAQTIGVDVSTISRWRRGVAKPSREHIAKICEQFALDVGTNLEEQPLFLSPAPVSLSQRREWLKKKIDQLSPSEMSDLFPAFLRLLGSNDAAD